MATAREEWSNYQEALRRGDRAAAAEYLRRYNEAKKAEGRRSSKPTIVRLSMRKRGPTAIPVDRLAEEVERSDDVYDLVQRMAEEQ